MLRVQVVEMLATMDIPVLRVSGVEADDTITCYATRAIEEGFGVAIVSSDKASISPPPSLSALPSYSMCTPLLLEVGT